MFGTTQYANITNTKLESGIRITVRFGTELVQNQYHTEIESAVHAAVFGTLIFKFLVPIRSRFIPLPNPNIIMKSSIFYRVQEWIKTTKITWSLVLTTHNGFVVIAVATPAPEAATMFAPKLRCPLLSTVDIYIIATYKLLICDFNITLRTNKQIYE